MFNLSCIKFLFHSAPRARTLEWCGLSAEPSSGWLLYRLANEGDDFLERSTGLEYLRDPDVLEFPRIFVWNDAPDDHEDVSHLLFAQKFHDARHYRVVCSRQNGQPNHLNVLLQGSIDNHLRCLPETGVDHFHASVAKSTSDNLRAAVVSIEAGFGNEYTNWNTHTYDVQIIERVTIWNVSFRGPTAIGNAHAWR